MSSILENFKLTQIIMKVGILLVVTGKYHVFAEKLLGCIQENFLPHYNKKIFLFADEQSALKIRNIVTPLEIDIHIINRRGFPGDTLYRYHYFLLEKENILKTTDVVYYMDIDFDIRETIGDEVLPDRKHSMVATHHPGTFQIPGFPDETGSPETRECSTAYIPLEMRRRYVAGGFNGGLTDKFMEMSEHIAKNTDTDDRNNVIAVWHDESHLNCYVANNYDMFKFMNASYTSPEQNLPGLEDYPKKIVSLDKDHDFIRSGYNYVTCQLHDDFLTNLPRLATLVYISKHHNLIPILHFNQFDINEKCEIVQSEELSKSYRYGYMADFAKDDLTKKNFTVKAINMSDLSVESNNIADFAVGNEYISEISTDLAKLFDRSKNDTVNNMLKSIKNQNVVSMFISGKTEDIQSKINQIGSMFPKRFTILVLTDNQKKLEEKIGKEYRSNVRFYESNDPEVLITLSINFGYTVVFNEIISWWSGILSRGKVFYFDDTEKDMLPDSWITETRTLKRIIKRNISSTNLNLKLKSRGVSFE